MVHLFARAAAANCHKLCGQKQQKSIVLEVGRPKFRCGQGHAPAEGAREGCGPTLSLAHWISGLWHNHPNQPMLCSLSLCVQISPFTMVPVILDQDHPNALI